jgi:hypothetical protein
MRKGITLAALCMLGAMVCSTSAMAYDDLYTDDTAAVKAVGGLCGSVGLPFATASKAWNTDGDSGDLADNVTGLSVPVRVNYGVMEKLTVFGIVPVFNKWDMGDAGESGFGDIWVGAKYSVMPVLTLRGALDLPTGDDKKGLGNDGGFGFDVAAMSSQQVDKIGLNGQVGVRYNVEDGDTKIQPGVGIYLDAEGVYSFTQAIDGKIGVEFMSVADGKYDGNDVKDSGGNYLDLKVGGAYKLNEKMSLGANLFYTLAGTNTTQDLTIMVKVGYAVK